MTRASLGIGLGQLELSPELHGLVLPTIASVDDALGNENISDKRSPAVGVVQ